MDGGGGDRRRESEADGGCSGEEADAEVGLAKVKRARLEGQRGGDGS